MNALKEKLSKLPSEQPSNWKEKAVFRRENREWLRKSAAIAVQVLEALKSQALTRRGLAERMKISPQQINKIVKGQENMTLEIISSLELALGIRIIDAKGNRGRKSHKK